MKKLPFSDEDIEYLTILAEAMLCSSGTDKSVPVAAVQEAEVSVSNVDLMLVCTALLRVFDSHNRGNN